MIGAAPFAELLAHPSTAGVPVLVETPSTGHEGHAADIATLTRLATPARRRRAPDRRLTGEISATRDLSAGYF